MIGSEKIGRVGTRPYPTLDSPVGFLFMTHVRFQQIPDIAHRRDAKDAEFVQTVLRSLRLGGEKSPGTALASQVRFSHAGIAEQLGARAA